MTERKQNIHKRDQIPHFYCAEDE